VISAMRVAAACPALLFDVADFAVRGDLTVPADDATAAKRGESEEPNKAHDPNLDCDEEQTVYR
jgi:hypothetical protein